MAKKTGQPTGAMHATVHAILKIEPYKVLVRDVCEITGYPYNSIVQCLIRLEKAGILRKSVARPSKGNPQQYKVLKKNRHLLIAKLKKIPSDNSAKPNSQKKKSDEISADVFGEKVFRYWNNLRSKNISLESEARDAKSAVVGLQDEVNRLNKDLASAEAHVKQLTQQVNKKQHQKVVSHSSYIELKKYSERLETEVDDLRKQLNRKSRTFPMSEIASVR